MRILKNPYFDPEQNDYATILAPLGLHRTLPGYAPTPLRDAPTAAKRLGVAKVSVKDESSRCGMPAFKILGASYAVFRAISAHLGHPPIVWGTLDEWKASLHASVPFILATATDGNHGRAVARMARLLGLQAKIFVPMGTAQARLDAIRSEGADLVIVNGSYDDAVRQAADAASERCLIISDTAWDGYEAVPQWVIKGYSTMFNEIDAAQRAQGIPAPDIVAVQIGVGALAAAVVHHYRRPGQHPQPLLVGVEPTGAACVLESIAKGQILSLKGPQHSIMAGLNCGTPSRVAWAPMLTGINYYVAIEDDWARDAMRILAADGIESGESGSAGLAGLLALRETDTLSKSGNWFPFNDASHVIVISTEGATDPVAYRDIVQGNSRNAS